MKSPLLFCGAFALAVVCSAILALPSFLKPRVVESAWDCSFNLNMLAEKLEQYARENNSKTGDRVELEKLLQSYRNGDTFRKHTQCLAGGSYPVILVIGQKPTCSLMQTNASLHETKWQAALVERQRNQNKVRLR